MRSQSLLSADRAVRKETRDSRAFLLRDFEHWLWNEMEVKLEHFLTEKPADPERICDLLVSYGRDLYAAGKSFQKYSETINAISSARPLIKRQMTKAWDLAFAWLQDEPHSHHPALPASVLLAMMSTALSWGWKREAALWGMAWSGIMRVGELMFATRQDVVLPSDAAPGVEHVLIKIRLPKTRGRGAKHQSARVDPIDLAKLNSHVFKDEPPEAPLWPMSAGTLRKRFTSVLKELGLPTKAVGGQRPFELASLRAGGATWLLAQTESPDLVRRRGRWTAIRTMEIYLQEISVATSLASLPHETNSKIQALAAVFTIVLERCCFFMACGVPTRAFFYMLTANKRAGRDGG